MIDAKKKAVKRWRRVLDAGNPVVDEENAAVFLEHAEQYVKKNIKKLGKHACTVYIPCFRAMLSNLKLHYDPTLETGTLLKTSWSTELKEEMNNEFGIDVSAEFVNVMMHELLYQSKELGDELVVNFDITDTEIKIYAKPYETE